MMGDRSSKPRRISENYLKWNSFNDNELNMDNEDVDELIKSHLELLSNEYLIEQQENEIDNEGEKEADIVKTDNQEYLIFILNVIPI